MEKIDEKLCEICTKVTIIARSRAKAGFYCGRNTGNVGKIYSIEITNKNENGTFNYNYNIVEEYRTTGGSYNMPNGRNVQYKDIPLIDFNIGKSSIPKDSNIFNHKYKIIESDETEIRT